MPNTVQLTQNGQPVYPVTDVSLITGLEERSGMRVIPYTTRPTASAETAGFIYMDESTLDLYVTKATSGSYSWVSAGNLSNIDLDNCVTKTEFEQLGQKVLNNCFVGAGATYSSINILGLKPGNKYRVYIKNPNWDMSGVPSAHNYKFQISSFVGSTQTLFVGVYIDSGDAVSDYYDITIPSSSDYISIGGRATSGVEIWFQIVEFTAIGELDNKIDQINTRVNLVIGLDAIVKDKAYVNNEQAFITDPDWYVSQLLPAQAGNTIVITTPSDITTSSAQKGVAFNSSKQIVSYFSLGNRSITFALDELAYVAISIRKSDAEKFSISANGNKIFGFNFPFVLQNEIEDLQNSELRYDNFLRGYVLAGSSSPGDFIAMSGYGVSEFIPLDVAGKTLTIQYGEISTVIGAIYFYDAQKNFLGYNNTLNPGATYRTVIYPDSFHSAFARISFNLLYSSAGLYVDGLLAWSPVFENAHTRGFINYLNEEIKPQSPLDEVINRAKQSLVTACRYGYGNRADEENNRKDCQMLIMTDTHTFTDQIQDHIDTCEDVETIDGMVLCGDYTLKNYDPQQAQEFIDQIKVITKPIALCLGNHDVGYHYYCGNSASHQQAYDSFIAPLVAAGKITNYTSGVPYYYVDDDTHKVRFICVYEYDGDLAVDETHWELVAYDATKPMISKTATYNQGDIVNVPQYTTGSFKAKETIDMTGASEYNKNKYPSYKVQRDDRVIREAQANWLANTLLSTPEGYKVVILTHQHFSSNSATQTDKKFCINQNYASGLVSEAMQTDLIADMVDAFMNKRNFVEKVVMKGDASYMNTVPDGQGGYYAYEVEADFSVLGNVGFLCYINGHHHRDMIWRHNTYTRQWGVSSSQAGYFYEYDADIRRSRSDVSSRNTITVISFDNDNDTIRLVKVGNQHTIDGRLRDFEVIDLNP